MKMILGSASARRKELLSLLGYEFTVDVVLVDEQLDSYDEASDFVSKVALKKGHATLSKYPNDLVICADTIVVYKKRILGKPKDPNDARKMISGLAGRSHNVLTGVFLNFRDYQKVFVENTKVLIDEITEDEINSYIHTDEPYDKAGGYAIQGLFGKHVKSIQGDFYNVMGLPINRLYQEIKRIETLYDIWFKKK
jgi:septum formation protein